MSQLNPKEFIITRKRKKYKFALFHNNPLCFELNEWKKSTNINRLEIGAGTGLFSTELAMGNLNSQFLAVDVKADRLQTGARKALEEDLHNIKFLRSRADQLPEIIPTHTLDTIWVTFPDPFPKTRYAKHRLVHSRFLAIFKELLKKDGALYFKTDAKNLFNWGLEQLVIEGWRLEELSFDLHDSPLADVYKIETTYEKRYLKEGLKINFVKATPPA